jgi:hypothetical protein
MLLQKIGRKVLRGAGVIKVNANIYNQGNNNPVGIFIAESRTHLSVNRYVTVCSNGYFQSVAH